MLIERNLPFQHGTTITADAPFRETAAWLEDKKRRGVAVVDIEASAVLALAEYYGIPAAALMIVSDELSPKKWKTGYKDQRMDERIKHYFFLFIDR